MKWFLILAVITILLACNNSDHKEGLSNLNTSDSLPEGKWNGEYIKVKDSLEEENKPKRKSRGSQYFNMGKVEITVDTMNFSIDLFDQKRNHVTINNNSLSVRIKSAQSDFLSIQLMKPNIVKDYTGNYKIDPDGRKSISSTIDFQNLSYKNTMQFSMVSGSTTVETFSPGLGELVLKSKGTFEDQEGNRMPGTVNVNMRFESVVSTYNPNS